MYSNTESKNEWLYLKKYGFKFKIVSNAKNWPENLMVKNKKRSETFWKVWPFLLFVEEYVSRFIPKSYSIYAVNTLLK